MRRESCVRAVLSVLVTVALSAVTSCTSAPDSEDDDSYEPEPKVEYSSGEVPQDRDADAVAAALARIDACALLDPESAGVKGYPESLQPEADGPHVCEITNREHDDVRATVGVELSAEDRFNRGLVTLGGSKAYVASTDPTFCRVALPVSFTHTIEFVGGDPGQGDDGCNAVKGFAAAAAKSLDQPGDAELDSGPDRWVVCDILDGALGESPDGTELRMGTDFLRGMDECGRWQSEGEKLGQSGAELQPVAADLSLKVEYGSPEPEFSGRYGRVNGRALNGFKSGNCVLAWNEWNATRVDSPDVATFTLDAPTCKRGKRLIAQVTKVLDDDSPGVDEPHRPILYGPDDADVAAAEGCADVPDHESVDCAPYSDADVPGKPSDVVREAESDPQVNCSVALDAVREHFGDEMQAVTAVNGTDTSGEPAYACGFVEPSHARQVWIRASSDPMGQEPDSEIDGRPAKDEQNQSDGVRQLWVALDEAEDDGHVYAEVRVTPDRSTGMYSDSPVDDKPLEWLDETMTDVMAEHL